MLAHAEATLRCWNALTQFYSSSTSEHPDKSKVDARNRGEGRAQNSRRTSSLQAGLKQQAWGMILLSAPQYSAPRTQPSIPSSSHSVWTTWHIELSSWHHPPYSFRKRTADPAAKLALSCLVCWGRGLLLGLSPTCPLNHPRRGSCNLWDIKHIPGVQPSCKAGPAAPRFVLCPLLVC